MNPPSHETTWLTVGGFAGHPVETVRLWLILAAGGGLLIVALSYWWTLTALSPWRRITLGVIRIATWCALLALLTAPMRVERTFDHPPGPRPLAVLVDRSGSMLTADNRHHRRLDEALATWQRLKPTGTNPAVGVKSFAFAAGLVATDGVAAGTALPDDRTELFTSLGAVLQGAPSGGWGGVVTLTDGLDNSSVDPARGAPAVITAALDARTPLYFIAGHNRSVATPFLRLRSFTAPAATATHTRVHLQAIFDSFQTEPQSVAVYLTVNGQSQPVQTLPIDAGRHLATWTSDYPVEEPGTFLWEITARKLLARTETHVMAPHRASKILYYEGALDWGYRFLGAMLQRDDRFQLVPVFNFPNAGIALPPGAIAQPPFSTAGLKPYGVVILANVSPHQISAEQQAALSAWVRDGGILLFLAPDDAAAQVLAASELAKMLPVVFAAPAAAGSPTAGAAAARPETASATDLATFSWSDPEQVREIFASTPEASLADQTPRFLNFARIDRAKPGAEILGRHPTATGPDGQGRILLALQPYGAGKSVVFATDALWRWKLSEYSQSRGAELFWENLFSWLTRDSPSGIYFDHPPVTTPVGQEVTLELAGTKPGETITATAGLAGHSMPVLAAAGASGGSRLGWKPDRPGLWTLTARGESGTETQAWVTVLPARVETGERSGAPPDEEMLRRLADATGGAVLTDTAPAGWHPAPPHQVLATERREPLWHRSWIFGLLLALYGVELLLRRRWNLL